MCPYIFFKYASDVILAENIQVNKFDSGTARFWGLPWIIEGATEKALPFKELLRSIFFKSFGFSKQKCIY
jgi:hypothetical protein